MPFGRLPECIRVPINSDLLEEGVQKAKDWAMTHGIAMRSKTDFSCDSLEIAPFTLLPSSFPKEEFQRAVKMQPLINELIHKVSYDRQFLKETLRSTVEVDEFTRKLFEIYEKVYTEDYQEYLSLGIIRSDLMLETQCPMEDSDVPQCRDPMIPYCCWKQVEINTIAAGFGWLGPATTLLHSYIMKELKYPAKGLDLIRNNALEGICEAIIDAWRTYGSVSAHILFIVEDVTYNISDQRYHEYELRSMAINISVLRKTLTEIPECAMITDNRKLYVDEKEIAVIYFRAGYEPSQYPSQLEWDAREMLEMSRSIKCPSLPYQLAGTKKVQQALTDPDVLQRFLQSPEKVAALQSIFTGLYPLDFTEEGERAIERAIAYPERYVLKPQREGGGHNVYGKQVREELLRMRDSKERTAWILMDRIVPPVQANYIIRPGDGGHPDLVDVVSELGIFGVVIGNAKGIHYNKQVGHMLRTKPCSEDEGGVSSGMGALDSPHMLRDID